MGHMFGLFAEAVGSNLHCATAENAVGMPDTGKSFQLGGIDVSAG